MDPLRESRLLQSRREFFRAGGVGLGTAALATLMGQGAEPKGGLPGLPHFAPKAKRVVYLMQGGAPSHVDLFDWKPELVKRRGQQLPDSIAKTQRLTTMTAGQKNKSLLPGIAKFKRWGRAGAWMCDFLPHTGGIADKICLVNSMHTDAINHAPAVTFFLTGAELPGRPSLGAWLSYGLGSLNENLPTFVVMTSRDQAASCGQLFYEHYWGAGFLPSRYQGVKLRADGDPVLYLSNPNGMSRPVRRGLLDDLAEMNHLKQQEAGDPEIGTRIAQYEMAFRMQMSVPDATDITKEPQKVLDMYGPDVRRPGSFARHCLLARRFLERGVRYVQLFHAGWDQHQNLPTQLEVQCRDTDQASAALVKDLEQRGLLDDTLVVWGGEFGRTVFCQGDPTAKKFGRDHHPRAFTIWMAGGGIKPGTTYGETDEFGHGVVKDGVDAHDFQATILHLLGIDHKRLTFKYQGRHFRLTDVHGNVVKGILA